MIDDGSVAQDALARSGEVMTISKMGSVVRGLMVAAALTMMSGALVAQMSDADLARKNSKTPTVPFTPNKHLYPAIDQAQGDLKAAFAKARLEHKRVLLDFGGDWCGDCQVLDIYFHQSPNKELLEKNFVKVNINIGQEDANLDIAHKYGVPVHGVPALAVVSAYGKTLVSQDKEFSDMRYMESKSVTAFLNKWKPVGKK